MAQHIQTSEISLSVLKESKTNPRKNYDNKSLNELASSMHNSGLLEPIIVRVINGEHYEVVAGSRRFRAAKILNWKTIRCEIWDMNSEEAQYFQIVENLQRENIDVMSEVKAFADIISKKIVSVADLAKEIGKSVVYIYDRLNLENLCDSSKDLVTRKLLPISSALQLAKLKKDDQLKVINALSYKDKDGKITSFQPTKNFKWYIERNIQIKLSGAIFPKDDENLIAPATSCDKCPNRSGSNSYLFSDVDDSEVCFVKKCFEHKTLEHLYRETERLAKNGKEVIKLYSGSIDNSLVKEHDLSNIHEFIISEEQTDTLGILYFSVENRGAIFNIKKANNRLKGFDIIESEQTGAVNENDDDKKAKIELKKAIDSSKKISSLIYDETDEKEPTYVPAGTIRAGIVLIFDTLPVTLQNEFSQFIGWFKTKDGEDVSSILIDYSNSKEICFSNIKDIQGKNLYMIWIKLVSFCLSNHQVDEINSELIKDIAAGLKIKID